MRQVGGTLFMDGVINIFKEKGYTSHDVVAIIRKLCGRVKCGHTGTLDPDAEGVLPICLGKATKLSSYIMDGYKRYKAELTLGIETTTEDASGEITARKEVNADFQDIVSVLENFKGEYMQTPPMYSAIKIKGKKLYELARQGKEIEREKRKVFIQSIEVLEYKAPDKCVLDVVCSKGTYIRTLCSDIGKALGCGGHMSALLRTETSGFKLEDGIKIDDLRKLAEENKIHEALIPMEKVLDKWPKAYIKPEAEKILLNGGKIYEEFFEAEEELNIGKQFTAYYSGNSLAGIYEYCFDEEKGKHMLKPVKMLLL